MQAGRPRPYSASRAAIELALHHRRVAGHDQHRAVVAGQQVAAGHHGVAGAKLLGLQGELDARPAVQRRLHQFRPVADHHDHAADAAFGQGVEHVMDHRPAADREQHLGQLGLHPRSLAGGQDDRKCFRHNDL